MASEPPQSQSHFTTFDNFEPDAKASFDVEFDRLAASQEWKPGSQRYRRERTVALRNELTFHYFSASQPAPLKEENEEGYEWEEEFLTQAPPDEGGGDELADLREPEQKEDMPKSDEENTEAMHAAPEIQEKQASEKEVKVKKEDLPTQSQGPNPRQLQPIKVEDMVFTRETLLAGYQQLCVAVGIPPRGTIDECKSTLKDTLVNIVDLIDTCRTGMSVYVWPWSQFWEFRAYTLKHNCIDGREAQAPPGILASLLQRLRRPTKQAKERAAAAKAAEVADENLSPSFRAKEESEDDGGGNGGDDGWRRPGEDDSEGDGEEDGEEDGDISDRDSSRGGCYSSVHKRKLEDDETATAYSSSRRRIV